MLLLRMIGRQKSYTDDVSLHYHVTIGVVLDLVNKT